jgi:hypothetical protein
MTSPSSASDPSAPVSGIFTTEFYLTLSTLVPGIWALLGLDAKHMSVALAVLHVAGLAAPILAIPVYALARTSLKKAHQSTLAAIESDALKVFHSLSPVELLTLVGLAKEAAAGKTPTTAAAATQDGVEATRTALSARSKS